MSTFPPSSEPELFLTARTYLYIVALSTFIAEVHHPDAHRRKCSKETSHDLYQVPGRLQLR